MRSLKLMILFVALFSHNLYPQVPKVDQQIRQTLSESERVPILVKLRIHSLSKTNREIYQQEIQSVQNFVLADLTKAEFQLAHRYKTIGALSGLLTKQGLRKLESHPDVVSIQLDQQGQGGLAQSVKSIQADEAHTLGFTGAGVVVGVLDTGVNTNHSDLQNDITHQHHFLNRGADSGTGAEDGHGHGSNVTGIVTSDGNVVSVGVAPDAKIVAIKVLDDNNRGWLSDWIAGIDYIVANNTSLMVQVINMSLVTDAIYGGSNCDSQQNVFADVAAAAKNAGIIMFASSGNTGSTTSMTAPACLSEVVAVGAVYDSDLGREPNSGTYRNLFGGSWPSCFDGATSVQILTCFTSRNASLDLVAPGAIITSVGLGNGASTFRGTSQASPHATGVAALMLERNPDLTPDEIREKITNTSVMVDDPATNLDFPLLNALEALDNVTSVFVPYAQIPTNFNLEQNFPNPVINGANGRETYIRYRLNQTESVTITVYDLLGREVKNLVNQVKNAGLHTIRFDAAQLPNGVYFYKMQVGVVSKTRKILLLQ